QNQEPGGTVNKTCEQCGTELTRRENKKPHLFNRRRYCNQSCYRDQRSMEAKAREAVAVDRKCLGCGKPLTRNVYRGKREALTNLERRKFCGPECVTSRGERSFPRAPRVVFVPPPVLV